MKRLILSLLLFCAIGAFGQQEDVKYLCDKIIADNDMLVIQQSPKDDYYLIVAQCPSYYDFELFQMKVNSFIREYSDIYVISNWEYYSDSNTNILMLAVTDEMYSLGIGYERSKKTVFFVMSNM